MKKIIIPGLVLVAVVLVSSAFSNLQNNPKQKTQGGTSGFAGTWKGDEKCNTASAAVAILTIEDSGPSAVNLSGIYSIKGKVAATVKHDTITILRQEVKDPNFINLMIEGELVVSGKPPVARGTIAVINNQTRDECTVQYSK